MHVVFLVRGIRNGSIHAWPQNWTWRRPWIISINWVAQSPCPAPCTLPRRQHRQQPHNLTDAVSTRTTYSMTSSRPNHKAPPTRVLIGDAIRSLSQPHHNHTQTALTRWGGWNSRRVPTLATVKALMGVKARPFTSGLRSLQCRPHKKCTCT